MLKLKPDFSEHFLIKVLNILQKYPSFDLETYRNFSKVDRLVFKCNPVDYDGYGYFRYGQHKVFYITGDSIWFVSSKYIHSYSWEFPYYKMIPQHKTTLKKFFEHVKSFT
jgi:hypothetical protein